MKGLITCLFSIIIILCSSCEKIYIEEHRDNFIVPIDNRFTNSGGDVFCAEKLLGVWQCSHDMIVNGIELKEIWFLSYNKADIELCEVNSTIRWTETFQYSLQGNWIKFSNGYRNYPFKIDGYLFPELYLRDSFGKYTIRNVK